MTKAINILFLAAEANPLVKIGGLGDIAGSLPAGLLTLPESPDARLVLPLYPQIKKEGYDLRQIASFTISHSQDPILAEVFQLNSNEGTTYLIDGLPISESTTVYSGDAVQDGHKFTFFSLAALEFARILNWVPDILHAHDWHAAPAVYKLRLIREKDKFFNSTKSLLTVHNLPYMGHHTEAALQAFGLPRAHMSPLPDWAKHLPLPLGLLTADKINTVSNGYANEILTPEFGARLDTFLLSRKVDISGILNGLDQKSWNPETDTQLPVNYTINSLSKRKENKLKLLKELNLKPDLESPLLAMINRMDYQKGVDLVPDALGLIKDLEYQVVILGNGNPDLEKATQQLDRTNPHVRSIHRFDGKLARMIYGGSDIILIPSRYEPCGLTQMIGMRYGCVPLARATGGLKDTIIDYNYGSREQSTGFLFNQASSSELAITIRRAMSVYQDKRRWQGIQRRGMKKDFSWEYSAKKYLHLYQELINATG